MTFNQWTEQISKGVCLQSDKNPKILTKESIIEQTFSSENLPSPLFAKEGKFLPFVKGGKEGFSFGCPYNYGLISNRVCDSFDDGFKEEESSNSCLEKN